MVVLNVKVIEKGLPGITSNYYEWIFSLSVVYSRDYIIVWSDIL